MPIIKHTESSQVESAAVALDLADLARQAERIVGDARRNAATIIDEGRAEAKRRVETAVEQARRTGHEQGFEEGRAAGEAQGRDAVLAELRPQLDGIIESWSAALEGWEDRRREMLVNAREDVLAFALELSRKVVQRWIDADPTIINDQLAEAIALVGRPTELEISINSADRPVLERFLPQLTERIASCRQARLRDDESIGPGGCRIATAGGEIDATIETQIDRIADALLPSDKRDAPQRHRERRGGEGRDSPRRHGGHGGDEEADGVESN